MNITVYVRVSTPRQAQTQTIGQQLDQLRAHLESHGWPLAPEHIFRDDGCSGTHLARPGLDRLRDAVAQGAVDRVLITAPDRLARKYAHQVLLLEEFERCGCEVEFLDRPMSHDPHDQLLLQVRGAVAEYERALIAERMRRGRLMKQRAGLLLPWTRPPYGYRVHPDHPRDPAGVRVEAGEAATVAEIFTAYLEAGQSLYGVAKHLMALRVLTPGGHARWNQATIRGILSNPAYTGQVYAGRLRSQPARQRRSALTPIGHQLGGRTTTPAAEWLLVAQVPPIVSQEQFDLVQTKLAHNRQLAMRHNTAHEYLLRCLVSCGLCRTSCRARTESPAYGDYVCRGKMHPTQSCRDRKCPARFIPARRLDALVWHDLYEVLTHPEAMAQALQRAQGGHWLPQELQARCGQLRKATVALARQLERLTDAYLERVIPLAEYGRRRHDLEQRLQARDRQRQQLEASLDRHTELTRLATSMADFCQRVQQGLAHPTFAQKRQLVELPIDCVVVTNEEAEIRYVIPTSSRSEHVRFCHLRKDYFGLGTDTGQLPHLDSGSRQAIRGVVLGAVSDGQDFQASRQPSACRPTGVAPIQAERLTVEPAMLLEAAHKIPAVVPKALQQGLGGIPGVKEDRLRAAAQAIPGIAQSLQGQPILRGPPLRQSRRASGIRTVPLVRTSRTTDRLDTGRRSWLEKTHARPSMAVAKGLGITVSSMMR